MKHLEIAEMNVKNSNNNSSSGESSPQAGKSTDKKVKVCY